MTCSRSTVWKRIGLVCAAVLVWAAGSPPIGAQNRTTVTVEFDGDVALQKRVADRVSRLLTALNRAHYFEEKPDLPEELVTDAGRTALLAQWDRAPFRCPAPSLTRTLRPGRDGRYELQPIPLLMRTDTAEVAKRGVFVVDEAGRIDGFSYASQRRNPPPKTGTVVVRTTPSDATVISAIGRGTRQRAPARFEDVPADVYAFTIRRAHYRDVIDTTLAVRPSRTTEHTVRLTPKPGALRLAPVPAGATVRIDSTRYSEPRAARRVEAGTHRVTVQKPSFAPWDSTVTVPPGDTIALTPELRRKRTPLLVRSSPPNARVLVDGSPMGRTPLDTTVAAGRTYAVQLDKQGYVPSATVRFHAGADSTHERRVVLTAVQARSKAESARIADLRADRTESGIGLRYALVGETGEEYDVTLRAVTPDGAPVALPDSAVRGAVGPGHTPGEDKQIALQTLPDEATIRLTVDDAGGRRWLYVIGGAVLAGGGTLLALFTGGGDGGGGGSGGPSFPAPPGLPN